MPYTIALAAIAMIAATAANVVVSVSPEYATVGDLVQHVIYSVTA